MSETLGSAPPVESEPPKRKRRKRVPTLLDRLETISKVLLIVGTFVGAIWALFQYWDAQQAGRVNRTLDYVSRYNKDDVLQARMRIEETWFAFRDFIAQVRTASISREDWRERLSQLVLQTVYRAPVRLPDGHIQKGLGEDIDRVQGFFGELQICIEANLCDKNTADSYFINYATRFYCLHKPFIQANRKNYDSSYALKAEEFMTEGGGKCDF